VDKSKNLLNLLTNPLKDSDLPGQGTCGSEQESAKPFEQPIPLKGLSHETDFKIFDRVLHLLEAMTYLVRGLVDQSQNLFNLLCIPLDCEGSGGNPPVHQGLHHAAEQDHRLKQS
jgi:hypothetical protein